ncbi:hypothetical protein PFMALIP_05680 [Plasmodium falciparum MaliPS096_E11]|uniref:Uncharacterized protein n=2 Tax=Plasmodium falciparum TaxID=5833 RepID=A0A024WGC7_PLAFA|nr:hypothetical protein PFMALIP_05680 [Plasmodium falciparum MaliPS096_E11]
MSYFYNLSARSATFLMKLLASGVEPTFSQGKVTYLTTGLLRQLNNSTSIKVLLKMVYIYHVKYILKCSLLICITYMYKLREIDLIYIYIWYEDYMHFYNIAFKIFKKFFFFFFLHYEIETNIYYKYIININMVDNIDREKENYFILSKKKKKYLFISM